MPYGLYLSAEGAEAQAKRLEVVANNLANIDTVGFKRELAVFQARYSQAIENGSTSAGSGTVHDVGGGVTVWGTATDFTTGQLKHTGGTTDVAVKGSGFFVVQKDDRQYLTRAGNFKINEKGGLVTQQGYPVLSDGNTPIVIDQDAGPIAITDDGIIRQGQNNQSLALVQPRSPGDLVKAGENLFYSLADTQPVTVNERSVSAGYLETSGVRPTTEMINMIEASRAVEANVNMMQSQDQMLSGLNRLLRA